MKKKLLLPYKKYRTLEHPIPYVFHLEKKGQHLVYFGSKHSFNPNDPQYKKIDEYWNKFLKDTNDGKNRIVLIEGGKREAFKTKDKAIKEGGEMNYIAYLAKENAIETFSPEPPPKYRYKELLKKFSKNEIAYYDFALVCYQWNRYDDKPNFRKYVSRFLEADKIQSGWKNFDFSLENMIEIHREIFGTEFDERDKDFFQDILDPISKKSVINKISLFEESGLRDLYIAEEIEKFWQQGKNIFIIYGVSHAVVQEDIIRDFIHSSK